LFRVKTLGTNYDCQVGSKLQLLGGDKIPVWWWTCLYWN